MDNGLHFFQLVKRYMTFDDVPVCHNLFRRRLVIADIGGSLSQISPILRWQRVQNGQPLGGFIALGRLPSSTISRLVTSGSAIGTADNSASV
jgi:hypothetical protein